MPWLEQGAVDIIQPDTTKCGGLSEARRIAWNAYDHNIQLVSHGWNTAIGLAADLHLAAAMPVARYVEYITPAPYIDEIVATPFKLDSEGMLTIPRDTGLGIEVDRRRSGAAGVEDKGLGTWDWPGLYTISVDRDALKHFAGEA